MTDTAAAQVPSTVMDEQLLVGHARRTVLIRRGNLRPTDRVHLLRPGSRQAWCSVHVASPRPGSDTDVTCRECLSTWRSAGA